MLAKSTIEIPTYRLEECSNGAFFMIDKWTANDENSCAKMREPHRHDGYGIDILLKGTSFYSIDFKEFMVTAPALVLIAPEQIHTQEIASNSEVISISFLNYFLSAESENVIGFMECALKSNVVSLNEAKLQELLPLVELLLRESQSNRAFKDTIIRNLLNTLVITCARMQTCADKFIQNLETNQLLSRFKKLVNSHFSQIVQVAQYADLLNVTPGHLNDTVKAAVGKTAKQLIDEKRVLEAKRLLFWGNHPVKEISWKLNFDDDAYFNRFFKKHAGQTPLEFQLSVKSTVDTVIV